MNCVKVFDLPPVVGTAPFDGEQEPHPAGDNRPAEPGPAWPELVAWADLTAHGSAPANWTTPSRDEIEQWVTPSELRVRAGAHAAEGSLICDPSRLALVMPSLTRISPDLSSARVAWLSELCHSAQENWRLVRFGFDLAAASVAAEVDLTGAPASCLPQLVQIAHSALVNAATWALPALALASNPSIESLMLDRHPRRAAARFTHPSKPSSMSEASIQIST